MRTLILAIICVALSGSYTYAQKNTPPMAVKTAFETRFPGATDVEWDKEGAHEYEAEFKMNGRRYEVSFSDTGDWMETSSVVDLTTLPSKVATAVNKAYDKAAVKTVRLIEKAKGLADYEIEIKKGNKTERVYYNSEGVVIKR